YLNAEGDKDVRRRIDLARRIAGLLDQYLVFRPDVIDAWRQGRDAPEGEAVHAVWQRKLFQSLDHDTPIPTLDALIARFVELLNTEAVALPERVGVWLCGGVPPAYLRFLDAVGSHTQVWLYVLSPTFAYWGDSARQRQLLRCLERPDASLRNFCRTRQLDAPHPLLESLGSLSLERQWLMLPYDGGHWRYHDVPLPAKLNGIATLLATLQNGLHMGKEPDDGTSLAADGSLRIHSCHGAMREVEVLQDQLRDAFESDPRLQPEDVVVLCPDLDTYAPLIDAVFGLTEPGQPGHMPYAVAGRSPRQTRTVVDAYFRVLDVLQGRFGASEIVDLLNIRAIQNAAGIEENQVQTIVSWVSDSGIRWGVDASQRVAEDLPATDLNTWQFGLDRLLMGYAMPHGGDQMVGEVLALDRAAGLSGEVLGQLAAFVDNLRSWREEVQHPRLLSDWQEPFCHIADQFLDSREDEIGVQRIRDAMDALRRVAEEHGFLEVVPFSVAAGELARSVDQTMGGRAFQLGGITFCDMAAMRSLPFKVVALLGLNDGVFPRIDRPVGFDLMARSRQPDDRSMRLEDKHLTLEALLAARSRLLVTYQGQNVRDHRQRPPSVVVEELLEAIEHTCPGDVPAQSQLRASLVTRHPLQAFSPRYFDQSDSALFSYDANHLQAAQGLMTPPEEPPPFFARPLPEDADVIEVRIRDLRTLLESPWELFLRRLNVWLPESPEADSDREPLILNHLDQWQIGDQWVQQRLGGIEPGELDHRLRRSGKLPAGSLGTKILRSVARQADIVVNTARESGVDVDVPDLPVRVEVEHALIVGQVAGLTSAGLRLATYSKVDAKRVLRLWLDHLLVAAALQKPAGQTLLVGRAAASTMIALHPIEPAAALVELGNLLRWYRVAIRVPLPFFRMSVKKAIEELYRNRNGLADNDSKVDDGFLPKARHEFEYQHVGTAEVTLPSVRTAFAGRDPFRMTCGEVPGLEEYGNQNIFLYLVNSICRPMLPYVGSL
ncbi:MAG: exodeoxyribonuclease V subunit gamma, partial [Planctomycetes bacterium]|nr:exodeoxyribonuclease V subunit gamma [Planctomycetota bacterium]